MSQKFTISNFEKSAHSLQQLIDENILSLEKLLKIKNKTYENFCVPYQLLNERLELFTTPIFHIDSVNNSPLSQKVYSECLPLLSIYGTQLSQNEELFLAIKEIKQKEQNSLNIEQNKVLDNEIRDFLLSGCGLSKEKKEKLEKLNLQSSELSKEFSQNLLDATNDWEMICEEKDVINIPSSDKELAKFEDENNNIKYKFTLQMPSYTAYITYGNNRDKREEIYKAYCTRAPQNELLIEKILQTKNQTVQILGFENYSKYSIETKMAQTQEDVIDFLEKLAFASKQKAKKELEEIKYLAKKQDGLEELHSYDLAYYSDKLKKEQYSIDEEYYKPYFEQDMVVDGLFEFLYKIFGIKFTQIDEKSWDSKVKIFDITSKDKYIGKIFLDLEVRKNKRGGAWMHNWHNKYAVSNKTQTPSAFVVCNFASSTTEQKSFLRHSDVVTLFHEMGHALHHLLTTVKEPFVSGINGVAWDTVEFPSQFLEYFAYEKEVLEMFAIHYQTKQVLPQKDIDKLIKARNFQSALFTIRQVEFALFDFKLYQGLKENQTVQELLDDIRAKYSVMLPPSYNKFQNGFAHIFSGGYSAGYYSYKWAEVLSADAFYLFKEQGIFNTTLALKYKDIILGLGGSYDMNELYMQFASKKPKIESLLKIDDIIS
jgi:oligopeptidase A